MKPILLAAAAMAAVSAPALAFAQGGAAIIDRNRPDRAPPGSEAPSQPRQRTTAPPARTHATDQSFAPFVLREVRVAGSSAPTALVGAASRPFMGRTVDAKTLNEITQAVAAAYENTDVALYLVRAPEQDFAGGVLRLEVIEGHIGEVAMHVEGDKKLSLIRAYAAKLTRERPLRRSTLERYLSLISDIPGLQIKTELQRTADPASVRLAIEGRQKRITLGTAINNRGTTYLGRTQLTINPTAYSLFREGDQTDVVFAFPTDVDRFQYLAVSHSQPIGSEGTRVQGSFGYLRTQPAGTATTGHAVMMALQASHPVIRRYREQLYVTADIDGLNNDSALLGQVVSNERSRALRLAASYGHTWPKTALSVSGTLSQGLDALGARTAIPASTDLGFTKLSGRAGLDHALTTQVVLRLRGAAQYSGGKLPAAELFSLGGDEFGRAFEASVLIGDSGYAGSAELAFRPRKLPAALRGSEVYGFVDGGGVHVNPRPLIAASSYHLASAGFGARAAILSKVVVQMEAAKPTDDPRPLADHGWRGVVSFSSTF